MIETTTSKQFGVSKKSAALPTGTHSHLWISGKLNLAGRSQMNLLARDVAKMIDHSLLRPTIANHEVEAGCALALNYRVASVCVKPAHVELARSLLGGSDVMVGTVCSFPHGNSLTAVKIEEALQALAQGAREIDMVVNIGAVLSEDWLLVETDIGAMTETIHKYGGLIKIIFENCYLEDQHKLELCRICDVVGVDWVKTSTGFGQRDGRFYGATDSDLTLMRQNVSERVQVKAAGGIRTLKRLLEVRNLGCSRVGATATEAMMQEALSTLPG